MRIGAARERSQRVLMMQDRPDWMGGLAARNLDLTLQALASGEYGEPCLDLDVELFARYRAGQRDALGLWEDPRPSGKRAFGDLRPGSARHRRLCIPFGITTISEKP